MEMFLEKRGLEAFDPVSKTKQVIRSFSIEHNLFVWKGHKIQCTFFDETVVILQPIKGTSTDCTDAL